MFEQLRRTQKVLGKRSFSLWIAAGLLMLLATYCLLPTAQCPLPAAYSAPAPANVQPRPTGVIVDTPTITIAGASATTTATPTSSAHEAQILWNFGTVTGSYGTCTVQAKTSYDGVNFLTLGSAVSVTVSSNTLNAWTIIEQLGTTSVTTSPVSAAAALGFGQLTEFTFSCTSYGTSAPVAISVIYR
jgi:hypothetical protein